MCVYLAQMDAKDAITQLAFLATINTFWTRVSANFVIKSMINVRPATISPAKLASEAIMKNSGLAMIVQSCLAVLHALMTPIV